MRIVARVDNSRDAHHAEVETDGRRHSLAIAPKPSGFGSLTNGGELLFLALATCFCNDVDREAAKRGTAVRAVRVEVSGEFGGPGEPARAVRYRAHVEADAPPEAIRALIRDTDRLTEIQNTLRAGCPVRLDEEA